MSGKPLSKQETEVSELFFTPQEDEPTDGAGIPPLVDGSGTPPLQPITAGLARPPDNQGVPPPPINTGKIQVMEELRRNECTLSCNQDYRGGPRVRKGLLKGNSASWLSTPTRHERKVQFTLPSRAEQCDRPFRAPSSSSGPTPPINQRTTARPSDKGMSTATSSGITLTRRHGGRGSRALSYTV